MTRFPVTKRILNTLLTIKMLKKFKPFRRDFDKTKCESFFIKDEKLLEKYIEI